MAGFLHDAEVLWYQPADTGFVEAVKGLAWSTQDGAVLTTGLFSNALATSSNGSYGTLWSAASNYPCSYPFTSWTFACWMSGVAANAPTALAGWKNGVNDQSEISIYQVSATQFQTYLWVNQSYKGGPTFTVPASADLKFVVGRVEFAGGNYQFYFSLNGSPWLNGGTIAGGAPNDPSSYQACLRVYQGTGVPRTTVDESIFWVNTAKFTDQELANLYALAATYGRTMNEYGQQYRNLASGTMPMSISGPLPVSGWIPLVMADNRVTGEAPLGIAGHESASGNIDHATLGHEVALGHLAGHTWGLGSASGVLDLFLYNQQAIGEAPMFIRGVLGSTWPLVLKTFDNSPSGTLDLFLYGSESGSTVGFTTAALPLFVQSSLEPASTGLNHPLFLRAVETMPLSSGVWQGTAFLKGEAPTSGTLDLFLQGPFAPATGELGCCVQGAYGQSDPVLSEGYTPVLASGALFLKGWPGAVGELPLTVTGFTWPSGSCDLSVSGFNGVYKTGAEIALHTLGILGAPSGSTPLFVSVSDVGSFSGATVLYTHGY